MTGKLQRLFRLGLPKAAAPWVCWGSPTFCVSMTHFTPLMAASYYSRPRPGPSRSASLASFATPTNLYSAFLRAPVPLLRDQTSWTLKFPFVSNNPYGLSVFITSPYLLYLFTRKWSSFDARMRNLLIAISVSALLIFSYFGVGAVQFGYRYSLDFLPGVFLLFGDSWRNSSHICRGRMKFQQQALA